MKTSSTILFSTIPMTTRRISRGVTPIFSNYGRLPQCLRLRVGPQKIRQMESSSYMVRCAAICLFTMITWYGTCKTSQKNRKPGLHDISKISTCSDTANTTLCKWAMVKSLCPATCSCHDPTGRELSTAPADGCPSLCMQTDMWEDRLRLLDCEDDDSLLAQWADEFHTRMSLAPTSNISFWCPILPCSEFLNKVGCGIIPHWKRQSLEFTSSEQDPCLGMWLGTVFQSRPLAPVCPRTCGCHNNTSPKGAQCPDQCSQKKII